MENFTELEIEFFKKYGFIASSWWCDLGSYDRSIVKESDDLFTFREPYDYYDTEGEPCTGNSRLYIGNFEKLEKFINDRYGNRRD